MNIIKYMAFLIFFLATISCSNFASYLDITKDKRLTQGYLKVFNQWTRKDVLYSQFDTKVIINTTYKSYAFNKAYLDEYARIYNLTDAERKHREEMTADFSKNSTEFFFYASMANKEANDFDRSNSIWTVYLIDEKGKRIEPLEIRRIEKISTMMEEFFPFINKYYGNCYSLKFPPLPSVDKESPKTPPMKLVFTSVFGRVEQTWP